MKGGKKMTNKTTQTREGRRTFEECLCRYGIADRVFEGKNGGYYSIDNPPRLADDGRLYALFLSPGDKLGEGTWYPLGRNDFGDLEVTAETLRKIKNGRW